MESRYTLLQRSVTAEAHARRAEQGTKKGWISCPDRTTPSGAGDFSPQVLRYRRGLLLQHDEPSGERARSLSGAGGMALGGGDLSAVSAVRGCSNTAQGHEQEDQGEPDGYGYDQHHRGRCDEVSVSIFTRSPDETCAQPTWSALFPKESSLCPRPARWLSLVLGEAETQPIIPFPTAVCSPSRPRRRRAGRRTGSSPGWLCPRRRTSAPRRTRRT
jgi:hypothetical protein